MKKPTEHSRNSGMSLIQIHDGRQLMLEKMRGKLAGTSQFHAETIERRRVTSRKSVMGWGWKLGLFALVAVGNIVWLSSRPEAKIAAQDRHAITLKNPSPKLSIDEQALYWAYALYDFHKLTEKFGVPKEVVIDSRLAAANLQALLPKVGARTRFAIGQYLPAPKKAAR